MFHMTFVQSLNLIRCWGDKKGKFSKKKYLKNLLRNHTGVEAETWNTCLGH